MINVDVVVAGILHVDDRSIWYTRVGLLRYICLTDHSHWPAIGTGKYTHYDASSLIVHPFLEQVGMTIGQDAVKQNNHFVCFTV